eukprot:125214_1
MKYISTKMQFKACEVDENGKPTIALCILKWGGELTPAGTKQCNIFAHKFRDYLLQTTPLNQQGFLEKMNVFMTDEVRVRKTAKEFALTIKNIDKNGNNNYNQKEKEKEIEKCLIDGPKVQHMLDDISSVKASINVAKQEIQHIFYNEAWRESLLDEHYLPRTPPNENE